MSVVRGSTYLKGKIVHDSVIRDGDAKAQIRHLHKASLVAINHSWSECVQNMTIGSGLQAPATWHLNAR